MLKSLISKFHKNIFSERQLENMCSVEVTKLPPLSNIRWNSEDFLTKQNNRLVKSNKNKYQDSAFNQVARSQAHHHLFYNNFFAKCFLLDRMEKNILFSHFFWRKLQKWLLCRILLTFLYISFGTKSSVKLFIEYIESVKKAKANGGCS